MTSVQNRAPLLIISNSIYARRSDGNLCPGTVQTRHSDGYIVKFADGAVERVLEDKLTWVGFWGMPPRIWPKTPVIHPMSSWETFRDRTMLDRDSADSGLKEQKFGSFSEQRVYESMSSGLPSETHNTHFQSSKADTNIPSHLLPKQIDSNQPRSSVLRISSNVLSKEGNLSGFLNFSGPVQDEPISVDKSLHNPPSHDEKHSKDNRSDFETQFAASLATEKSRQTTDTREAFQGHPESDWPLQQVLMYKYSLDRGGSSSALDVGASYASQEEEEMRMANAELEYYKKEFRRSSPDCSPSVNPSHFISSPLPFFSPPFEIAFLNASAPAMPSSFRLHTKTKKKNEKKKCRKVYGIENRHFWCTQCRWKKACTRFKTANKITTNEFA